MPELAIREDIRNLKTHHIELMAGRLEKRKIIRVFLLVVMEDQKEELI